jgi:hypothetical protein
MATKTATKAAAKKTTKKPMKKTVAANAKKTVKSSAASKQAALKSFRPVHERNFFTFKISLQTVYWTILIVVIIALQLMIINAQLQAAESTNQLYNQLQNSK